MLTTTTYADADDHDDDDKDDDNDNEGVRLGFDVVVVVVSDSTIVSFPVPSSFVMYALNPISFLQSVPPLKQFNSPGHSSSLPLGQRDAQFSMASK